MFPLDPQLLNRVLLSPSQKYSRYSEHLPLDSTTSLDTVPLISPAIPQNDGNASLASIGTSLLGKAYVQQREEQVEYIQPELAAPSSLSPMVENDGPIEI